MAIVPNRDMGEFLQPAGLGYFNATAAGAGDATEVNGATVDRQTYGMPESAALKVQWIANVAASQTLALTITLQDSADGSTWTDVTVTDFASAITVATGALTNDEDYHLSRIRLSGLRRYVRAQVSPDLSNSGVDTAVGNFCFILGPGNDTGLLDAADATYNG